MSRRLAIAREEWRFWLRSHLAVAGMALMALLLVATTALTIMRMAEERHARLHHQAEAQQTFLAQPDRHPHRMVHYGHYVFRTPAPLTVFDPGLDPVTGQSIFLEGHRQNSAMFADAVASANLGGLQYLTPALVYQLFAPLLLILLGYGLIVREREAGTLGPMLAQGVGAGDILLGKALALLSVVGLLLLPVVFAGLFAMALGDSWQALVSITGVYGVYLIVWGGLILATSAWFPSRRAVIAGLVSAWLVLALILPGFAVNMATGLAPAPGKLETDLVMLADKREVSDGHNAADPAFAELRANLLAQYGVDDIEALPVNFRGIVAQYAEAELTTVLNEYAEARMASEAAQAATVQWFGWLSPVISLGFASRALAGTDLESHHRFLREAEALRIDFVQGLNRVHAEQLVYTDDINRSRDPQAERRTRVAAENWAVLGAFTFEPAPVSQRLRHAGAPIAVLLAWLGLMACACGIAGRKLEA